MIKADLRLNFLLIRPMKVGGYGPAGRSLKQAGHLWEVESIRTENNLLNERTSHTSDLLGQGTASCPPSRLVGASFKLSRFRKEAAVAPCASRVRCQGRTRCQPPVFPQAQFPRWETPYMCLGRASAQPGLEAGHPPWAPKMFPPSMRSFEHVFEAKQEDLFGDAGKSSRCHLTSLQGYAWHWFAGSVAKQLKSRVLLPVFFQVHSFLITTEP